MERFFNPLRVTKFHEHNSYAGLATVVLYSVSLQIIGRFRRDGGKL